MKSKFAYYFAGKSRAIVSFDSSAQRASLPPFEWWDDSCPGPFDSPPPSANTTGALLRPCQRDHTCLPGHALRPVSKCREFHHRCQWSGAVGCFRSCLEGGSDPCRLGPCCCTPLPSPE